MTKTIRKGSRGNEVATLQRKLNLIADGIFGPITDEAVRDFQKIARPRRGRHRRSEDLGRSASVGQAPNTRRIDKIILHCSATPGEGLYRRPNPRVASLPAAFRCRISLCDIPRFAQFTVAALKTRSAHTPRATTHIPSEYATSGGCEATKNAKGIISQRHAHSGATCRARQPCCRDAQEISPCHSPRTQRVSQTRRVLLFNVQKQPELCGR